MLWGNLFEAVELARDAAVTRSFDEGLARCRTLSLARIAIVGSGAYSRFGQGYRMDEVELWFWPLRPPHEPQTRFLARCSDLESLPLMLEGQGIQRRFEMYVDGIARASAAFLAEQGFYPVVHAIHVGPYAE